MEDRQLNLKEAFWNILLGWRMLLVFAVIGALLFSALAYYKDMQKYETQKKNFTADKEKNNQIEMSEEEMRQVNLVLELDKLFKENEEYMASYVFRKNTYEELKRVNILYYIDLADEQGGIAGSLNANDIYFENTKNASIIASYIYYMNGENVKEQLLKVSGLAEEFSLDGIYSVTQNQGLLVLTVIYSDDMDIDNMIKVLKEEMQKQKAAYTAIADYNLVYVGENNDTVKATEIMDGYNDRLDYIINLQQDIVNIKSKMSDKQLEYLEVCLHGDMPEEVNDDSDIKIAKPGLNTRYMVLGILCGIVLACIYIVLGNVLSVKLQEEDISEQRFGLKSYGHIIEERKKKFLNIIDSSILKIKNRRKKKLTEEQYCMSVITSIVLDCRQNQIEKLCLTGTEIEKISEETLKKIKDMLMSEGIKTSIYENIFYNAQALKECVETGNIVVIEQVGVSIYDEIVNEIKKAEDFDINIMGVVVVC
ncbi:MAG: hypothetical protein HDT40_11115 [Lachnospiraceae bacterium]|nr:hypothetical protein [Lachnospiraceae bacterium]